MHLATDPIGLSSQVLVIIPALLLWLGGLALITRTSKSLYALLGLIATIGGFMWVWNYFGATQAVQFIAGVAWAVLVSFWMFSDKSPLRGLNVITMVVGVVTLIVVVPGTFEQPTGTVWEILVDGWNTIVASINTFVGWIQRFR